MEKSEEWEDPIDYDEDTREECCLHADDRPPVGFECHALPHRIDFRIAIGYSCRNGGSQMEHRLAVILAADVVGSRAAGRLDP